MNDLLASVVIPTFNRSQLLLRAIQSVLSQTHTNLEVIVVNDASTDNTQDVVREISDSRVRLINSSTNRGLPASRNAGGADAKGKYIFFLDDDDEWLPTKLEKQIRSLESYPNEEYLISYTQIVIEDGSPFKIVLPDRPKRDDESLVDYLFLRAKRLSPSTLGVPASFFRKLRFRPEMRYFEDWEYFMDLVPYSPRLLLIPEPLVIYHNEPRSDRLTRDATHHLLKWLDSHMLELTMQTRRTILARELSKPCVDIGQRWLALKWFLPGAFAGALTRSEVAVIAAKILIPTPIHVSLKRIAKVILGKKSG